MKKLIIIALIATTLNSFTQELKFSPFSEIEKNIAYNVSLEIIAILNEKDLSNLDIFLSGTETNFNGEIWFKHEEFINFLKPLVKQKEFSVDTIVIYTFDDVINSNIKEEISKKLSRTFTNEDLLVTGKYIDLKDKARYDLNMVLEFVNNSLKISSIHLSDAKLIIKSKEENENFRTEIIENFNLEILIPKQFSEKQVENNMITFTLEGETPRDAVIHIVKNELKAPVEYMTYKWAEYIALDKYKSSGFVARLHPLGIIYEYYVLDENNIKSKGITIGIEKNKEIILIQFFSFAETYDNIWREIDYMIRKIKYVP
jgi:hypothetical protein